METPYLYLFRVTYDLNSFQLTQLPKEPVSVIPFIWMFPHLYVALLHKMEARWKLKCTWQNLHSESG